MDLKFTLDFLSDLAKHNNKEWMNDHKKRYQEAKGYVIEWIAEVIKKSSVFDQSLSEIAPPPKTLFRINRDIRFSKNKDPYKTHFGASIAEGSRKSGNPEYYIHLMPSRSSVGGGIYQPDPATLQKVRQEIDYNGAKLRSIINDATFKKSTTNHYREDKLKTAPKGYPKDHEDLDLLQLKHYVFMHEVSDEKVTASSFADRVSESFRTLYPFNSFIKEAIS